MSTMNRFYLTGKTAMVTGSGQGIGKAIAIAFADAGANVVLAGINVFKPEESESQLQGVARELESRGAKALPVVTDMRNSGEVEATLEKALETFGTVDVLVNNVAGGVLEIPILELSEEQFGETLQENFITAFLGCRIVGAHMAKRRSGSIVNFSSLDGRGPCHYTPAYSISKAAVISLTQNVAAAMGPLGVRANCIAPSLIRTEFIDNFLKQQPELEEQASTYPLRRYGRPDEVAALALFLASDASSFITGQTIDASGGALPGTHVRAKHASEDIQGLYQSTSEGT